MRRCRVKWWQTALVAIIIGLITNEVWELSGPLAVWLVRQAAQRSSRDPELAATRADEWIDVVYSCPGKLAKLGTALAFAGWAVDTRLGELWEPKKRWWRRPVRRLVTRLESRDRGFVATFAMLLVWGLAMGVAIMAAAFPAVAY